MSLATYIPIKWHQPKCTAYPHHQKICRFQCAPSWCCPSLCTSWSCQNNYLSQLQFHWYISIRHQIWLRYTKLLPDEQWINGSLNMCIQTKCKIVLMCVFNEIAKKVLFCHSFIRSYIYSFNHSWHATTNISMKVLSCKFSLLGQRLEKGSLKPHARVVLHPQYWEVSGMNHIKIIYFQCLFSLRAMQRQSGLVHPQCKHDSTMFVRKLFLLTKSYNNRFTWYVRLCKQYERCVH